MAEGGGGIGFLANIPWWGQLLILLVLVLGLSYLGDVFLCSDLRLNAEKDRKKAEDLKKENEKTKQFIAQYAQYKAAYEQALQDLKSYRERLPESPLIPNTVETIYQQAEKVGLVVRGIKPKTEAKKDFYKEVPLEVKLGGTYNNIGVFFDRLENFPRIMRIGDLEMKKATPQTDKLSIEAVFTMSVFYAAEADVMNVPEATPAKDAKAKPAPAPAKTP